MVAAVIVRPLVVPLKARARQEENRQRFLPNHRESRRNVYPLVHGELSWLTAQRLTHRRDRALVTVAGVIPDLDGLTQLGGVDLYGKWHHVLTHGIIAAVGFSLLLTTFSKERLKVLGLTFLAFHLHLLCDLAGSGPGWPIFYLEPFSNAELM